MPTGTRKDPALISCFRVEIDSIESAAFRRCAGLKSESEVFEYQEGGDNETVHKLIGPTKASNLVLTKGYVSDPALFQWRDQIANPISPSSLDEWVWYCRERRGRNAAPEGDDGPVDVVDLAGMSRFQIIRHRTFCVRAQRNYFRNVLPRIDERPIDIERGRDCRGFVGERFGLSDFGTLKRTSAACACWQSGLAAIPRRCGAIRWHWSGDLPKPGCCGIIKVRERASSVCHCSHPGSPNSSCSTSTGWPLPP